jgi:hypothetical protein
MKNKNIVLKTCLTALALSVAGLANAQDTGEPVKIFTEQLTSHAAISAAAISISADAFVDGHIASQAAATTGARSEVQNIVSGAATGIGAAAKTCNIYAGAAIAVGAGSTVGALSTDAAVTLGALTIRDEICDSALAVVTSDFDAANAQIKSAQSALDTIPASSLVDAYTLVGSMDTGVYEGAAITIPASTVITFDANGQDGIWIFKLSGAMTVGAGSKFEIINAGDNNAVIWNIGGALTLGAGSTFLGTAFVEGAVSGATASVSCGNLYATGAISIGSIGSIGGDDCKVAADQLADFVVEDGVSSFPEQYAVGDIGPTGGKVFSFDANTGEGMEAFITLSQGNNGMALSKVAVEQRHNDVMGWHMITNAEADAISQLMISDPGYSDIMKSYFADGVWTFGPCTGGRQITNYTWEEFCPVYELDLVNGGLKSENKITNYGTVMPYTAIYLRPFEI